MLPGDLGYAALDGRGQDVGAAWLRKWSEGDAGFGFIDELTPELSMAVRPGWRGQGIGTSLLHKLLGEADRLHSAVSLSVDLANPAIDLYRRFDFEVSSSSDGSATMRRSAQPPRHARDPE